MQPDHSTAINRTLRSVPVNDIGAERSVLAGMICGQRMSESVCLEAFERLTDESFHVQANRDTFACVKSLYESGEGISIVSVAAKAQADGVGSITPVFLAELAGEATTESASISAIKIVRRLQLRRDTAQVGVDLIHAAYDATAVVEEEIGAAINALEASSRIDEKHDVSLKEAIPGYMQMLTSEEARNSTKIYTPWANINAMVSHIETGEVLTIGARPSNCKSLLASLLLIHAAEQGVPCGEISLEMTKNQLINRWCASGSGVEAWKFRANRLNSADMDRVYAYADKLYTLPVHIWDDPFITLEQIRSLVSEWVRKYGLKLLVLDYLQLVNNNKKSGNREREVAEVSRLMKQLAVKHDIAVVLLSQVNREVEKRQAQKLRISDLRESGAAEQDADMIWLIQPFDPKTDAAKVPIQISVAKSRSSATGDAGLLFDRTYLRIEDR